MFRLIVVTLTCLLWVVTAQDVPAVDDRIVGGQQVSIVSHPYQVSLQLDDSHFCGGSIHSPLIIVTAAHCAKAVQSVALSRLQVRLGSANWKSGGVTRGVAKIVINPLFDEKIMIHDVALVKLDSPVTYTNYIQNIDLQENDAVDGNYAKISGWGTLQSGATSIPSLLRGALIQFITRDSCSSSAYGYGDAIKPTMICAGDNGKDSCQGDSGGPLVSNVTKKLVGIVSWGNGCAQQGFPGVYAYIPPMRDWIISAAKALYNN